MPDNPHRTAMHDAATAAAAGDEAASLNALRRAFGLPPGTTQPTAADMVHFEQINTHRAAEQILADHAGRRDLTLLRRAWYEFNPVHSRDLPWLVWTLLTHDCFTPDAAAEEVADAWTGPEYPQATLSKTKWLAMFRRVGRLNDHGLDQQPARPVPVAWRAANPKTFRGLAWTTDRDKAEWFATRFHDREPLPIWQVRDVPASKVLARFTARGESEVVLDVTRLDVTPAP